jgi:anti-sigma regulatory factor (Ser/Thr protein kinase)
MEITRKFSVTPTAPATARDCLDGLGATLAQERLDDLRLIVSELVTNCVRHSGLGERDRIQMTVAVSEQRVRVEVTDQGRGFTQPASLRSEEHGRGLDIVDRLASRWGCGNDSQTTVWAELAVA